MKKMTTNDIIVQEKRRNVSRIGCIREMNEGFYDIKLGGLEREGVCTGIVDIVVGLGCVLGVVFEMVWSSYNF